MIGQFLRSLGHDLGEYATHKGILFLVWSYPGMDGKTLCRKLLARPGEGRFVRAMRQLLRKRLIVADTSGRYWPAL